MDIVYHVSTIIAIFSV